MNKETLHRLISESDGNESNICQIYAIRDGKTVYDDSWHGFTTEDAMNVNSVTKGITALLAGIALDRGCIKSVDQKVMDFYPDYSVKRGEKTIYEVTIRHLLTMTAPSKGNSEPWKKVCTSEDWTLTILDHLGGRTLLLPVLLAEHIAVDDSVSGGVDLLQDSVDELDSSRGIDVLDVIAEPGPC